MPANEQPTVEQLLSGILALLIAQRDEADVTAKDRRKTEVILDHSGLPATAIASLMDKKIDAVRKTIQRAK